MSNIIVSDSSIIKAISPNEQMPTTNQEIYFEAGRSALRCIDIILQSASLSSLNIQDILDFPCGHGRILRYIKAAFPNSNITACDIIRDGVDFCASTFDVFPVYSEQDPADIPLDRSSFDLIWVGSLFTHLDQGLWLRFLLFFRSLLRPNGLLIFTTHGYDAYRKLVTEEFDFGITYDRKAEILYKYDKEGFGYAQYPGNDTYYGLSLSSPDWVVTQIAGLGGLRLVSLSEMAWVEFHDVFGCVLDPTWCRPEMLNHG